MITLTTEQAQQIEEALEDIVRVFKFETGTPVEALDVIRAARAQEDTVCGFSLWLNRESWGHVVDGLMLERERSEQRKTANPESNSNIISDRCAELITQINDAGGAIRAARAQEQAEIKRANPIEHTTAENYEHFLSYMYGSGARHSAFLCQAYFDGAGAPHEEYEAYMAKHPEPVNQEPVARPFECWSTNDGDSWFEHPADAQIIEDTLGSDAKVGDEFEVLAGWDSVRVTYRITAKSGNEDLADFEVECISHPHNDAAPVDAKAIRAEALEEAAKVCDAIEEDHWNLYKGRKPYTGSEAGRADPHEQGVSMGAEECAAAIRARGLK